MRLIDADKLKEDLSWVEGCAYIEGVDQDILQAIDNAPTVKPYCYFCGQKEHGQTVERPQGEWLHRRIITKDRSFDMVVCSNCQTEFSWDAETGVSMDNYKTCPNCSAKMEGPKND